MANLNDAINECGGPGKLACKIGASANQVINWRVRGVPILFCPAIERATDGAVTRRDLRPDDWWLIWPELVTADFPIQKQTKEAA